MAFVLKLIFHKTSFAERYSIALKAFLHILLSILVAELFYRRTSIPNIT